MTVHSPLTPTFDRTSGVVDRSRIILYKRRVTGFGSTGDSGVSVRTAVPTRFYVSGVAVPSWVEERGSTVDR